MTNVLSQIKSQITNLYKQNSQIHLDISQKNKKSCLSDVSGEITAIYPNIFTVLLNEDDSKKSYAFQYVDLITHNISIKELDTIDM